MPVFSLHILSLATLDEQEAAAQKHRQFPFLFLIVRSYYARNISSKIKVVRRVSGDILKVIFNQNITILCQTNVRLLTGKIRQTLQSTTVDYAFRSFSIQSTTNEQKFPPYIFSIICYTLMYGKIWNKRSVATSVTSPL